MLIEKHKNELLTLLISMMNEKQNCGRILRLLILFCLYGICLPPLHAKQDIASPQQTGKTYTIKGVVLILTMNRLLVPVFLFREPVSE